MIPNLKYNLSDTGAWYKENTNLKANLGGECPKKKGNHYRIRFFRLPHIDVL
jgi:hypothetical protein